MPEQQNGYKSIHKVAATTSGSSETETPDKTSEAAKMVLELLPQHCTAQPMPSSTVAPLHPPWADNPRLISNTGSVRLLFGHTVSVCLCLFGGHPGLTATLLRIGHLGKRCWVRPSSAVLWGSERSSPTPDLRISSRKLISDSLKVAEVRELTLG